MKKSTPTFEALKAGLDRSAAGNTTGLTLAPVPQAPASSPSLPANTAPPTGQAAHRSKPKRTGAQFSERSTCYFPTDLAKIQEVQVYLAKNGRPAGFSQAVRVLLRRAEVDEHILRIDNEVRSEDMRRNQ